jgi:hypothetical protein
VDLLKSEASLGSLSIMGAVALERLISRIILEAFLILR